MAIDVYGATWCGDCHRAKNALDRFGAAYTWHDIEQEEARPTVPLRSAAKSTSRSCSIGDGVGSRSSRPSWTSRTSSRSLACSGER